MASSEDAIKKDLLLKGIKKDKDVEDLYMSNRNLAEVTDLQRFRYLKRLWLNGNKLRRVNCLGFNFRLSELHLHNNDLCDISGSLRHLTCLEVLTLHNNYLTDLTKTTREFDKMNALSVLNLYDNPLTLEPEYRLYVINSVPSLAILDQSEVTKSERNRAHKIYHQTEEKVKDKIAFGRRSMGPPHLYFPARPRKSATRPVTTANNYLKNSPSFETLEEAANARLLTKSLTLYSMFDWSTVPRMEDRRQLGAHFSLPSFVTHVYR